MSRSRYGLVYEFGGKQASQLFNTKKGMNEFIATLENSDIPYKTIEISCL